MHNKKKSTFFWIMAGLILTIALVFSIQNFQTTEIRLLVINIRGPLFLVTAVIFLLGFVLGRISLLLKQKNQQSTNDRALSDGK